MEDSWKDVEVDYFDEERENNFLFADLRGSLKKSGEILHLRKWGKEKKLKFKDPKAESELKTRPEHEVGVEKLEETEEILKDLGFHRYMIYEKDR